MLAASLVVTASGAGLWVARSQARGAERAALRDVHIQPLTLDGKAARNAISPDGRLLIYQPYEEVAINVRRLADGTERLLVPPGRFDRISSLTVGPRNGFVDVVAVRTI